MRRSMTLLQRAVVQRLAHAGYHDLSNAAHTSWQQGEMCSLPNTVTEQDALLRQDFDLANQHATVPYEW
ncbi:MAG: hypothetical protein ACJ796_15270 [Gemmatimonadaceae bacterium]